MNKTKKRRKTQRRRRRKQMRGGLQYIGQLTSGVIGTFEFEAINSNDLASYPSFYINNIRQFNCPFLDGNDIDVIIHSHLDTNGYALDTGTYGYKGDTQENKVFLLYFIEPSVIPFVPHTKTMIGFISCSIYRPRNICYVNWECSDASVIKSFVTIGDRRVEKASHVLQAFFINYLASLHVTTIYKQLHTYDHPDNGHDENRGTLIPRSDIIIYNLETAFELFTKRQENDKNNLEFVELRNDHYSKFDISKFNKVHPTLTGQTSEYPNRENRTDLLEMLSAAKQYENDAEIEGYIDTLKKSYSHIERLMYMRNLCNTVNMNALYTRKPKTEEKTAKILPKKAYNKGSKTKKSLFDDD